MSSFENWLRILSMESIHFFERETATVKKHFQKTCQFLFSVQNSSTLHRKRLEIASKIEKLDFYKLVKKCWQFHNSRHFTKSTTWVKTKPVFVGNITWKAPHLYPLGLPVRLQGCLRPKGALLSPFLFDFPCTLLYSLAARSSLITVATWQPFLSK